MSDFTIKLKNKELELDSPKIMGILNLTPDSFYDGGKHNTVEHALKQTEKMISEGADIIDIGAFSSRPGAQLISPFKELERLLEPTKAIKKNFPDVTISIDTFRCSIVLKMFDNIGEFIVNDISGGDKDPDIYDVCGSLELPYICMHMQGSPETMQAQPEYKNIVEEQLSFFKNKINITTQAGIPTTIIDPGFGFGKTIEHNYTILSKLERYKSLNVPTLIGLSRKSMIHKFLNISPNDALNGSTALHMAALLKGANIIRVHDVKEANEVVKLFIATK